MVCKPFTAAILRLPWRDTIAIWCEFISDPDRRSNQAAHEISTWSDGFPGDVILTMRRSIGVAASIVKAVPPRDMVSGRKPGFADEVPDTLAVLIVDN
ncbi:hypothetical protein DIE17_30615 [Burkholderia sp. Bp9099]|nr:hypothetical protein DIE17_30615 [Burkholderia sp. Bp9099]